MHILILGRGPIGTQYGWALEKAGHIVDFYVRPGSAAKYGNYVDLNLYDARKEPNGLLIQERWPINVKESIPNDHNYDLIIVSVNHYQVEGAIRTIAPIAQNATILMFSNIWGELKSAVAPLPMDQIVWGFPGGGGGFSGQSLISGFIKAIFLEAKNTAASKERNHMVVSLFEQANFIMDYQENMQSWYWDHLILNAAMHLMILKAGSYRKFFQSMPLLEEFALLIKELLPLIPAMGEVYPPNSEIMLATPTEAIAKQLYTAFSEKEFSLALMDKVEETHFMTDEMRAIYPKNTYNEAQRLGLKVPRLESLKDYFI